MTLIVLFLNWLHQSSTAFPHDVTAGICRHSNSTIGSMSVPWYGVIYLACVAVVRPNLLDRSPDRRLRFRLMDRTCSSYHKMVFRTNGMATFELVVELIPATRRLFHVDQFFLAPCIRSIVSLFQRPLGYTSESLIWKSNSVVKINNKWIFIFQSDTNLLSEIHQVLITSRTI